MKTVKPNIRYEARAIYHKYNSGRGDNGNYHHAKKFNTLASAQKYLQEIKLNDSAWAHENFRIDGYFVKLEGIFKLTEEKVQ